MLLFSFKSVRMNGLDNLPANTPVILMCNHPVGFMEPLIITTRTPRQLYYLARGDAFKKPLFRWLLNQIHIHPIYRFRDGFSDLRNNESAILTAMEFIKSGRSFLVFAEGSTALQRSIRPIQKGVSRIIHDILSENPEQPIVLIPVGYNDNEMTRLGSHVTVNFGKPIYPHDLFKSESSKPRFLKQLTKLVETSMYDLVPQVNNPEDEAVLNQLIGMHHSEKQDFTLMKEYANKVNAAPVTLKENLNAQLDTLMAKLKAAGSSVDGIYHKNTIGSWLTLVLGFIPFIIGQLFNYIPFTLGSKLAQKKVNKPEFTMVITMVFRSGLFALWYVLWFFLLTLLGVPSVFWILLILGFLAVFGRRYFLLAREKVHSQKVKHIRQEMKQAFSNIDNQLHQF